MKAHDTKLIRLIALFKFLKATLLIALGLGAMKLVHMDTMNTLGDWIAKTGVGPGSRYVGRLTVEAAALTPEKIRDLEAGSFIYAALFLTEGIGLWLVKRWAEWLTVIITGSLVPVELYVIFRHPGASKVLLLIINVAVILALAYHIKYGRSNITPVPATRPNHRN